MTDDAGVEDLGAVAGPAQDADRRSDLVGASMLSLNSKRPEGAAEPTPVWSTLVMLGGEKRNPVLPFSHRLPLLVPGTADVADVELDIEPEIEPEMQPPNFEPQLAPSDEPLREITEVDDDGECEDDDDYEDRGLTGETHPECGVDAL